MLFLPWVASTQAVRNDLSRSLLKCILILYRVIWYLSYIDILVYTWWIAILYIFMLNKFCLSPDGIRIHFSQCAYQRKCCLSVKGEILSLQYFNRCGLVTIHHIHGLMQCRLISIANALKLCLLCTESPISYSPYLPKQFHCCLYIHYLIAASLVIGKFIMHPDWNSRNVR